MALTQRLINVIITLASGTFKESGTNTLTLTGHRVSAKCLKAGTPYLGTLQMSIFGMTLSVMDQLSTLGMILAAIPRNIVTVMAGDAAGVSMVFSGTILQAWIDFDAMPSVAFHIEAQTIGAEAVIAADPASINGSADVSEFMEGIAKKIPNCSFENNGVDQKLSNPYFYGSIKSQAQACADAAGINWTVDNNVLAIWPKNGFRGGAVPVIAPPTLVGYPSYGPYSIILKTIFNPAVRFGSLIQVESSLPRATGKWRVFKLDHNLDSLVPGGQWFTIIEAENPQAPGRIPR